MELDIRTGMSSSTNAEISRFLLRYCTSSIAPYYAVMLRGPWGGGKTHFIRDFRETLAHIEDKRSIYVSLYGVAKPSDIADQFFQQIHPKLADERVQKVWGIAKNFLKGTIRLDLDSDKQDDGTLQISIPELGKWASTAGAVLIFDDLERASMPLIDVLGYINQFVEHEGYRVIVVANEEKCQESTQGRPFSTIKEKVIGRTFEIIPDASSALNSFLNELVADDSVSVLSQRKQIILKVYNRGNHWNLRQLRQAVLDFSDFWSCLPVEQKNLKNKPDFLDRLVEDVFSLSIEYRAGELNKEEISELRDNSRALSRYLTAAKGETVAPSRAELALKRHGFSLYSALALPPATYAAFFSRGLLNLDEAGQGLALSKFLADEHTPEWQRLWNWRELSNTDFEKYLEEAYSKFRKREYTDEGELLHVAGILFELAKNGLLPIPLRKMVRNAIGGVKELGRKRLIIVDRKSLDNNLKINSAFGYRFIGHDTPKFLYFLNFYVLEKEKFRDLEFPKWAQEWMEELKLNPELWAKRIMSNERDEAWYYNHPVFSFVDPNRFCSILLGCSAPQIDIVRNAIAHRFEYVGQPYLWKKKEAPFFSQCVGILETAVAANSKESLSNFLIHKYFVPELRAIVAQLCP